MMLFTSLWRALTVRDAEVVHQAHHVMIVLRRRGADSQNPVEQIAVAAIEQSFEPVEFGIVHTRQKCLGERAEQDVVLLGAAMPGAEQQPLLTDVHAQFSSAPETGAARPSCGRFRAPSG